MTVDIDTILNELKDQYPKWLMEGLNRSPEIKNIEKALISMSKIQTDVNKGLNNTAKAAKKVADNFDTAAKVVDTLADNFDDATKSAKDLSTAQSALKKSLSGIEPAFKHLMSGKMGRAAEDITDSLRSAAKDIPLVGGLVVGGLTVLSTGLSKSVEILAENNDTYIKMAQAGFQVNDSLSQMSKSAFQANMGLAEFTELAVKNASVLAQWGPEGTKNLADLSRNVRFNSEIMGKFGFDIDEVNDYLTDYLKIQQRAGFLNRMTQQQMDSGFKQFISDAAEFSTIIGYSRKDIIETATKLANDPSWDYFLKTLGKSSDAVQAAFTQTSLVMTDIAGPEVGGKLGDLIQDVVRYGQAYHEETLGTVKDLTLLNPQLLKLIYSYGNQIRSGEMAAGSSAELSKELVASYNGMRDQTAVSLDAAHSLTEFGKSLGTSESNVKNFQDRVKAAGGNFDEVIASMKKARQANEDSVASWNIIKEAGNTIHNAFDMAFVDLINSNKDAIKNLAKMISDNAYPTMKKVFDWIDHLFDPSTDVRGDMVTGIADLLRDVFHELMSPGSFKSAARGATAGAVTGAALGSMVGPLGTLAGGAVGGVYGGMIGYSRGQKNQQSPGVDTMLNMIIDKNEGGGKLVNDTGGLTKWGISSTNNPGVDVAHLTKEQAIQIYKDKYVSGISGFSTMSPQTQMMALDAAINKSPKYANDLVRLSGGDVNKMAAMRKSDYAMLAQANPAKYGQYLKGWDNRVDRTQAWANNGNYQAAGTVAQTSTAAATTQAAAIVPPVSTAAASDTSNFSSAVAQKQLEAAQQQNALIAQLIQQHAELGNKQIQATNNMSGTL